MTRQLIFQLLAILIALGIGGGVLGLMAYAPRSERQ
jgi:hypothetical protein